MNAWRRWRIIGALDGGMKDRGVRHPCCCVTCLAITTACTRIFTAKFIFRCRRSCCLIGRMLTLRAENWNHRQVIQRAYPPEPAGRMRDRYAEHSENRLVASTQEVARLKLRSTGIALRVS